MHALSWHATILSANDLQMFSQSAGDATQGGKLSAAIITGGPVVLGQSGEQEQPCWEACRLGQAAVGDKKREESAACLWTSLVGGA